VFLLGTPHAGAFFIILIRGREPLEFLPNVVWSWVRAGEVDVCRNNGSVQMGCALVLMYVDWSGSPKCVGNAYRVKNEEEEGRPDDSPKHMYI